MLVLFVLLICVYELGALIGARQWVHTYASPRTEIGEYAIALLLVGQLMSIFIYINLVAIVIAYTLMLTIIALGYLRYYLGSFRWTRGLRRLVGVTEPENFRSRVVRKFWQDYIMDLWHWVFPL